MTTSIVAEGKIRLAINQGVQVPEGWLIDGYGEPTTEPNDFKDDPPGAILPLGGDAGHNDYGLSIMVELLGGALSGQGCAAGDREMISFVADIERMHMTSNTSLDMETFYHEVEGLMRHVKSSASTRRDSTEILAPGEPEIPDRRAPGHGRHRGGRQDMGNGGKISGRNSGWLWLRRRTIKIIG